MQRELDPNAIEPMLMPAGPGLFANIELGSTWETIQTKKHPKVVVRDDRASDGSPTRQLRHDLGSKPGQDGFYLTFDFDKSNTLERYEVSVYGRKHSRGAVASLAGRIVLHLKAQLGPTQCSDYSKTNSEVCAWVGKPGTFGVRYHYMKPTQEDDGGTIKVSVSRSDTVKQ